MAETSNAVWITSCAGVVQLIGTPENGKHEKIFGRNVFTRSMS
ncbi:MAG: hypothetical protein ACJ8M1_02020 [Chthoniobacterales bacterium]